MMVRWGGQMWASLPHVVVSWQRAGDESTAFYALQFTCCASTDGVSHSHAVLPSYWCLHSTPKGSAGIAYGFLWWILPSKHCRDEWQDAIICPYVHFSHAPYMVGYIRGCRVCWKYLGCLGCLEFCVKVFHVHIVYEDLHVPHSSISHISLAWCTCVLKPVLLWAKSVCKK